MLIPGNGVGESPPRSLRSVHQKVADDVDFGFFNLPIRGGAPVHRGRLHLPEKALEAHGGPDIRIIDIIPFNVPDFLRAQMV